MASSSSAAAPALPTAPTGYSLSDDYLVHRSRQGGRWHYTLVLPLVQIPAILPVPDPQRPLDDNRQVRLAHAQGFADYVQRNPDWHSGPLTVRTRSDVVDFVVLEGGDYGIFQIGTLSVPRNARDSFKIIDGQHRVLGIDLLLKQIEVQTGKSLELIDKAERNGDPQQAVAALRRKFEKLKEQSRRVAGDSICVDLVIENSADRARQIFVDVANNAVGISKSVTTRFDNRKVVNRAMTKLLTDPQASDLIVNKVDQEKDRITGGNSNLLGASHLADIVRTVEVGISGRISANQEQMLDERRLADQTNDFLVVLTSSFALLREVAENRKDPADVRDRSLLLSTTMLRVLAGVYHNLRNDLTDAEIVAYFSRLDPFMGAPVVAGTPAGDLWLGATKSEVFVDGATAPGARAQQVKELCALLTAWASAPPSAL